MAANIYGIISTDPEPEINLDLPGPFSGGRRVWGVIHLWLDATPPVPTSKWAVVGDVRRNDSSRFISVPAATLGRLADKLGVQLAERKREMAMYENNPGNGFQTCIRLSQADLDLIA